MTETASPPPSVGWATGPLGTVQAADREIARQTALRARAVAEFAASRPASADRPAGQPGGIRGGRAGVHERGPAGGAELVVALAISAEAAEALLVRSLTLVHRLPATLAALESGALHAGHLCALRDKCARIADDGLRAAVEAELLAWAAGRVCTPAQLAAKARRTLLARDA